MSPITSYIATVLMTGQIAGVPAALVASAGPPLAAPPDRLFRCGGPIRRLAITRPCANRLRPSAAEWALGRAN